ncbi:hypothetical protein TRAPUB_4775 [Trametes pubescens]|uniref:Uncharacterized protein n=1 Tax=Trametes pubescens TaxID=154538 RepID=A0A1M2VAE8_TRAPU|nr:hypothetical protein TRAPUB_4775 [Trametes pubescens]
MPGRFSCLVRRTCLFLLAVSAVGRSLSVNRTIDDEKGDSVTGEVPVYTPDGSWSQGSTCSGCFIQLDPSQTFDGTWHDSTHTPGDAEPRVITAHFTGTAVYVFNAIANTVPFTTTLTNLSFTLDGDSVGQYVHTPSDSTDFQYNVPVFVRSGLSNVTHTIVIEATGDTNSSLVLFDYIIYTFEEDTSAPTITVTAPTQTVSAPIPPPIHPPTITSSISASGNAVTSSGPTSGSPTSSSSPSGSSAQTSSPSGSSAQTSSTSNPGSAIDASSQKRSTISAGAVAGGVVGGVIVVVAASVLAFCFIRKRRQGALPYTRAQRDLDLAETSAVEPSATLGGPTLFGSTAQSGSAAQGGFVSPFVDPTPSLVSSPFVDPIRSSLSNASAPRPPPPHWASPSAPSSSTGASRSYPISSLASAQSGSTTPPSNPTSTHSGSIPGLLASEATFVPSSVRGTRPLPQPSPSDSGSSTGYASTPHSAASLSQAGLLATSVQHPDPRPGLLTRRSLRLAGQPIPADVKAPLADGATGPPSPTRTEAGAASEATGSTTLRAQVAALQEEVERLREQQEWQRLFDEAPPQYHEA